MKKILLGLFILLGLQFQVSHAASVLPIESSQKTAAINKTDKVAMLNKIAHMSVKEYEQYSNKKLNFFQKLAFKTYQKKLRAQLAMGYGEDSEGFNIGGFLLGFLLGLLGVLGAYLFSKDHNFRKWTWIGWGCWVVLFLIILVA